MKVDVGRGYRVYFTQRGDVLVIILCGGDKSTQPADIKRAKAIAKELEI
jgi:putative addiction module killer protein